MCLDEHISFVKSIDRLTKLRKIREAKTADLEDKIAVYTSHFNNTERSLWKVNLIDYYL